ncbi:unnamed protein product [Arctogadus glacialis]
MLTDNSASCPKNVCAAPSPRLPRGTVLPAAPDTTRHRLRWNTTLCHRTTTLCQRNTTLCQRNTTLSLSAVPVAWNPTSDTVLCEGGLGERGREVQCEALHQGWDTPRHDTWKPTLNETNERGRDGQERRNVTKGKTSNAELAGLLFIRTPLDVIV